MATIAPLRSNGVSSRPKLLVLEPKTTSQLQSPEGRQIAELADKIRHNLTIIKDIKEYFRYLENAGETDYNPVPPKRSERVIMRSQFKGRKKPLPYILDEE
jgi:hypothetical protein